MFLAFYSFYRTYTQIVIIFELAHDLLYKIKHKAKFAQKEKGKATVS